MSERENLDQLCIDTLRILSVETIEKANSGHPGLPLGAAPMAYTLWSRFLCVHPQKPQWFNRDRFVLSPGHGSALLYALLHLSGYHLSLEEIKNFRQWESKTPGHPEYGMTPGVEATTGPLGQGFAMAVGMAIAEKFLAGNYCREEFPIVDHYTYAIVSDGDLMEGVAAEAASLAGHLQLSKLIYLYDSNNISIEGSTDLTFSENVAKRFESYNWQVLTVEDGNDVEAMTEAINQARDNRQKPSLIIIKTHIGYGSPKQDQASVHGSPLKGEDLAQTRKNLGWSFEQSFHVPQEAKDHFQNLMNRGIAAEKQWQELHQKYQEAYPDLAKDFSHILNGTIPEIPEKDWPVFAPSQKGMATRSASGKVMNFMAKHIKNLIGGSADLAPSNNTYLNDYPDFNAENFHGRNLRFGIREHAMAAITNGMALHGGVIPYCSTFLIFSDYMRPAIRLASMMNVHSLFVFTHDSIGLGEDGPTHQPIEQLMTLRAIPGVTLLRPAEANETRVAWKEALAAKGPVILALTRQNLPELSKQCIEKGLPRGAYILSEAQNGKVQAIIIATGSEVHLALAAQKKLAESGIFVRIVSMPSWELFEKQSKEYRQEILPTEIVKISLEAGITLGWNKYADRSLGINQFGASAPWQTLYQKLGLSLEHVIREVEDLVKG